MRKLYLLFCAVFTIAASAQNYDYTLYSTSNSGIASNNIYDLKVDASNNVWLATNSALTMFNGTTFTNYNFENTGVEIGALRKIAIDGLNRKWVTTAQNGLIMYNGTTWTHYRMDNSGLPSNVINDVTVDASNNVWLATWDGLVKFTGTTWTTYTTANSQISGNAISSVGANGNTVYFTNEGILGKVSGSTFSIVGDQANRIRRNAGNDMYVDTFGGGYLKYTNENVSGSALYQNSCMLDCQFGGMDVDQNNKLWIAYSRECESGGLQNFTDCQAYFPAVQGASFEYTSCLEVVNSNLIWIGTIEGGLIKMAITTATCNAPSNLTVGQTTSTSASFSWTASSSAPNGGYTVMINNAPELGGVSYHTNTNSLIVTDLNPNSDYYWWVAADCGNGQSQWVSGGFFNTPIPPPCFTKMSNGDNHTLAIKADGSLWGWGLNDTYQLGLGVAGNKNTPQRIGTATNWVAVAASGFHSLALKSDGTLWAWGQNNVGQLGDNTTTNRMVPTQIGTATNWSKIAVGGEISMAIKTDGTLWVWGNGVLGFGDFHTFLVPTQLGTATYKYISTSGSHSLAVRTNDTLWAWGWNNNGSVGNNSTTTVIYTPIQIGTATWKFVEANQAVSYAIQTNGSLWAWGANGQGQLGLGTGTNVKFPTQIGSVTTWQRVQMGIGQSLAIRTDGSLWGWGFNTQGELSTGDVNFRPTPVRIGFANDWTEAGGGDRYSIFLKNNGDAYTAGWSPQGQMGLGPNALHTTMVQIACPTTTLDNDDFTATAEMKVYPNPVKEQLNLSFDTKISTVGIYNLLGQEVIAKNINANEGSINVSHLSAGTYIVKAIADSKIVTVKVVKK